MKPGGDVTRLCNMIAPSTLIDSIATCPQGAGEDSDEEGDLIASIQRTAPVHILFPGEDFLQPEDPIPSFGGGGGPNRLPILIPELEDFVTAEERREIRELGCEVHLGSGGRLHQQP